MTRQMNDGKPTTERLYAWLATDPNGVEGIIAVPTDVGVLPLVNTSEEGARAYEPIALVAAKARSSGAQLVVFDRTTVLKVIDH